MNKLINFTLVLASIVPSLVACNKNQLDSSLTINPDSQEVFNTRSGTSKIVPTKLTSKSSNNSSSKSNTLIGYSNNDSCGMFQIKQNTSDFVTARHCIKRKFKADSPVLSNSGKAVKLTKPRLGNATIITKHFNSAIQINVKVVEINQCQAFFVIPKSKNKISNYIQSGDSGSPVIQNDARNNLQVIGALSGGLMETKIKDKESGRSAFIAGSMVYDDCVKYKSAKK